ncbi:melanoma antigen recognized by T-cells 1 isoform 2-T2 [Pluvialis apricaria]
MPRNYHHPDGNFFRGKGHSYLAAEEALGVGLFILVLAILLIFGCWYYKRRSGYKSLRVPDAPPAYDKIVADQSPPPYSP